MRNGKKKEFKGDEVTQFGKSYYEVTFTNQMELWHSCFLILIICRENFQVTIDKSKQAGNYFWNVENAPIWIKVKAKKEITSLNCTTKWPVRYLFSTGRSKQPVEEITLIPFGYVRLSGFLNFRW